MDGGEDSFHTSRIVIGIDEISLVLLTGDGTYQCHFLSALPITRVYYKSKETKSFNTEGGS